MSSSWGKIGSSSNTEIDLMYTVCRPICLTLHLYQINVMSVCRRHFDLHIGPFFFFFYIKLTSFQHQLPTGEQLDYYFAHFSLVKSYIFTMHLFNVSFKSINIHSLDTLLGTPC